MADEKGKYKRKVKLIKIKFQMRFVIIMLLLMFLTGLVVSWGTYCLDRAIVNQLVEVNVFKTLMISWILLLFVIGVGLSILVSHRVAGPIYRFEKIFDKLLEGDLKQKVFLRKNDELQELAEKINGVIEFMSDEIVKGRENVELISKEMEKIDENISKKPFASEELVKISNSLKDIKERIKKINTAFTI